MLVFIGLAFFFLPGLTYVLQGLELLEEVNPSEFRQILLNLADFRRIFAKMGYPERVIFGGAPLVGIGIWTVRKWGYWYFVIFTVLAALYHAYKAIWFPTLLNLGSVGQTVFFILSLGYMLREEIHAPYMRPGKSGWRREERIPMKMDVSVDGQDLRTLDMSPGGMSVEWPACSKAPEDEVKLHFLLGEREFDLTGKIALVRDNRVGLAFQDMDRAARRHIGDWLEDWA